MPAEKDGIEVKDAWKFMTDLNRCKVVCYTPEDVLKYYKRLVNDPDIKEILKMKPRFHTGLKDVMVIFNFRDQMVCEIQIVLHDPSPLDEKEHFVYEVKRVLSEKNIYALQDTMKQMHKKLVDKNELFTRKELKFNKQ
jgi:hypothetical protein